MSTRLPILKARLVEDPATDCFQVHVRVPEPLTGSSSGARQFHVMTPLAPPVIQTLEEGMVGPGPAFTLNRESAQALFEALWEAGLRPEDWRKPGPIVAASPAHDNLQDVVEHLHNLHKQVGKLTHELLTAQREHVADLRHIAGITHPKDQPQTASDEPRF